MALSAETRYQEKLDKPRIPEPTFRAIKEGRRPGALRLRDNHLAIIILMGEAYSRFGSRNLREAQFQQLEANIQQEIGESSQQIADLMQQRATAEQANDAAEVARIDGEIAELTAHLDDCREVWEKLIKPFLHKETKARAPKTPAVPPNPSVPPTSPTPDWRQQPETLASHAEPLKEYIDLIIPQIEELETRMFVDPAANNFYLNSAFNWQTEHVATKQKIDLLRHGHGNPDPDVDQRYFDGLEQRAERLNTQLRILASGSRRGDTDAPDKVRALERKYIQEPTTGLNQIEQRLNRLEFGLLVAQIADIQTRIAANNNLIADPAIMMEIVAIRDGLQDLFGDPHSLPGLNNLEQQILDFDNWRLTIWTQRLQRPDADQLEPNLNSILKLNEIINLPAIQPAVHPRTAPDFFQEWTQRINYLSQELSLARNEFDNYNYDQFIGDRSLGGSQRDVLKTQYLIPAETALAEWRFEANSYWEENIRLIHPHLINIETELATPLPTQVVDPHLRISNLQNEVDQILGDIQTFGYGQEQINFLNDNFLGSARNRLLELNNLIAFHWRWRLENYFLPSMPGIPLLPKRSRELDQDFRTRFIRGNERIVQANVDTAEKMAEDMRFYLDSSPEENWFQPHTPDQRQFLHIQYYDPIRELVDLMRNKLEGQPEEVNMDWLQIRIAQMERLENYVSDAKEAVTTDGYTFATLIEYIQRSVADRGIRDELILELESRVYLHDAWVNFKFGADFNLEKINMGQLSLKPQHFERLLHGVDGVGELVAVALSMYELALKGRLPPFFENAMSHNWRATEPLIKQEIALRLGPKGALASWIASELVEATGMIAFYENEFKYTSPMQMRDVMNTEGRRNYYGAPSRLTGAGLRQHGYDTTVGKYWNRPGAVNSRTGQPINPIIEVTQEYGEPVWDLVGDFWCFSRILRPDQSFDRFPPVAITPAGQSRTITCEPIKTLSRNNRYGIGEAPDFAALETAGLLSPTDVLYLKGLDWSGAVKYQDVHTIDQSTGRPLIKNLDYKEWVEQMQVRLKFHRHLTSTNWTAKALSAEGWFQRDKTDFDYLVNSAAVLRDLPKPEQDITLRRIQTLLLWSILREHSPAYNDVDRADWWDPAEMIDMIFTAETDGFISGSQAKYLIHEAGLDREELLVLSRAEAQKVARDSLRKAGIVSLGER